MMLAPATDGILAVIGPSRFTAVMGYPPPAGTSAQRGVRATDSDGLADLIEAIAENQDRNSFALLFDHFAPRLKGFYRKGGTTEAQAEDLMQDVMLTLWQRAGQFDRSKAAVSTWVYAIARNRRIDLIRRERHPEFDPEDPAFVPDNDPLPDEHVAIGEDRRRLESAVAALPEEQARLLRMAFYEDKPHGEIASETDLPLGTVKSRIRLALVKLRTTMKDERDAEASS